MTKKYPTQQQLKDLLEYDPNSGIFVWKERIGTDHGTKVFNSKYAGKQAGSVISTSKGDEIRIRILGSSYLAHRLAWLYMKGNLPECVEHINNNRTDNRFHNLKASSILSTLKDRKLPTNNTSGQIGVSWDKHLKTWTARIEANRVIHHLGKFKTKKEAVQARLSAEASLGFHPNHGRRD
jgi:hypothetical protein